MNSAPIQQLSAPSKEARVSCVEKVIVGRSQGRTSHLTKSHTKRGTQTEGQRLHYSHSKPGELPNLFVSCKRYSIKISVWACPQSVCCYQADKTPHTCTALARSAPMPRPIIPNNH